MVEEEILVLGATGSTGRRVADRLREAGYRVRPASRSGAVRFDWGDPATWEPAVAGASKMYLMAPDGVVVDPSFITCAVNAGITRIVLLSSRGIEAMGDERLLSAERTVRASGAEWTIVRPDWFAQNFDEGVFRPAVMAKELVLPLGGIRQAFVDADDIAAVAAAALTEEGHAGRSYELTGPDALSFAEALAAISRAAGRRVEFRGSEEDYRAVQAAAGADSAATEAELAAFAALRGLGDAEPTDTVRRVRGQAPKTFAAYAAEAAARGAWRD
ncbi:MAG: NAD(P)H-binding protein [Nocardiopsaceae bacterium]|nr:NAD(P)H-binding protein [Nocardiopsaceae bacterium]